MTTATKSRHEPKWHMAGTERTNEYEVLVKSPQGMLGIRDLGGTVRIRVEPATPEAATALAEHFPPPVWKQPGQDGQNRFSLVVFATEDGVKVVEKAIEALGKEDLERDSLWRYWRRHFA